MIFFISDRSATLLGVACINIASCGSASVEKYKGHPGLFTHQEYSQKHNGVLKPAAHGVAWRQSKDLDTGTP